MTDTEIIYLISKSFGSQVHFSKLLKLAQNSVSQWKQRGIPARWRPTIWALLEQRCPEVAATLDRDSFLGVIMSSENAA